jgi:WS/DGAT/MGAT family acyltransferase
MADPEATSRDRMSDFEALMWEVERNPMLSNAFANLTLLDRPPERERFVARMGLAVRRVPRLRQRAVPAPGRLTTPEWLDDTEFDLDHHLRWMSLGGHATEEEVCDLVAELSRHPFDRGRPLWEFIVVEGLEGGRAAMLQRLHHTITDGEGGIKLSLEFLDLEREPDPGAVSARTPATAPPAPEPDLEDTRFGGAARAVADGVRQRGGQLVGALGAAGSALRHPGDAAAVAASLARQALVTGRCSPLWTQRSLQRWFGTTVLDLADVKAAAHVLGGSVNDFFVTGASAGAGNYHRSRGAAVDHLRVSMPVSSRPARRRTEASGEDTAGRPAPSGGNTFSPTQTLVPTGACDPRDRFAVIHEALHRAKSERALGVFDSAATVVNLLPSAALVAAGGMLTGSMDFVCSNVRAAPFDVYIAGALIEANYPVGPLAGVAFNLTTMSYRGQMFLGLVVDPVAVEEPEALLHDIERGYEELFAAAGLDSAVG